MLSALETITGASSSRVSTRGSIAGKVARGREQFAVSKSSSKPAKHLPLDDPCQEVIRKLVRSMRQPIEVKCSPPRPSRRGIKIQYFKYTALSQQPVLHFCTC